MEGNRLHLQRGFDLGQEDAAGEVLEPGVDVALETQPMETR